MEFNIQKIIKKIKINNNELINKKELLLILQEYHPLLEYNNFSFIKGVISFKKISPLQRTHIKKFKKEIIQKSRVKKIHIRDII